MGFAAPYQRVAIHRLNSSVYVTGSQFRARQYSRDYWLMVVMVIFHYLWGEPPAVFVPRKETDDSSSLLVDLKFFKCKIVARTSSTERK